MKILKRNSILVCADDDDVNDTEIGGATLGIVYQTTNKPGTYTIPSTHNVVYFTSGIQLSNSVNGDAQDDWFIVDKSNIVAIDTKKFNKRVLTVRN